MVTTPLRVDGADLSHHNPTPDLTLAKLAGLKFLYHKVTEGTSFVDPTYAARRLLAKVASVPFGGYHFAHFESEADARVEAHFFLARARPKPGDLRPMLDLEVNAAGLSRAELTRCVKIWVDEVEHAVGVKPIIYTPFALDDNFGCPLWVARYSPTNASPAIPSPWTKATIRQFTNGETGLPNSLPGLGHVDLNHLPNGVSVTELIIPKAKPAPTPTAKPTLRIAATNAKSRVRPVRFMLKRRNGRVPDVCAVNEGNAGIAAWAVKLSGYRNFWTDGGRDKRRGAVDTLILTRKTLEQQVLLGIQASEQVQPVRIAPDRFIHVTGFAHAVGKTAVVNIHPDAATDDLPASVARVRETAEFVATLARTIVYLRREGFHVVVVGDSNWRKGSKSPDWTDIAERLTQIGMDFEFDGLELVAWSDGLRKVKSQRFTAEQVGSDHPAHLYDFARA